jgi:hypothetical protein
MKLELVHPRKTLRTERLNCFEWTALTTTREAFDGL